MHHPTRYLAIVPSKQLGDEVSKITCPLEIQIWQMDQKIVMPEGDMIHISFHNKYTGNIDSITLGSKEFHAAMMGYAGIVKAVLNYSGQASQR